MTANAKTAAATPVGALVKSDPLRPALVATGPRSLAIRAGTIVNGIPFDAERAVELPDLKPGCDYGVIQRNGALGAVALDAAFSWDDDLIGGFHFAPGGNAAGRSGGDGAPQINPCSIWDLGFRPACPDPRGMALVERSPQRFWADIYLTAADHRDGTSRHGVTIADGEGPPQQLDGHGRFGGFDYGTALAVLAHHGKGLLSFDEFTMAAFGVAERSSAPRDPKVTGLDAAHTSRFGLMQATGNLWVWGHDGDPDTPRASLFGGSWFDGGGAGSRCALVGAVWPGASSGFVGARGRSDHLVHV